MKKVKNEKKKEKGPKVKQSSTIQWQQMSILDLGRSCRPIITIAVHHSDPTPLPPFQNPCIIYRPIPQASLSARIVLTSGFRGARAAPSPYFCRLTKDLFFIKNIRFRSYWILVPCRCQENAYLALDLSLYYKIWPSLPTEGYIIRPILR